MGSCALLGAVGALAMLQTFGILPCGSRFAPLHGRFLMFGARKMVANAHVNMAFAAAFLAASNIFAKRPLYWTLRQYGGFLNIWTFSWCQATVPSYYIKPQIAVQHPKQQRVACSTDSCDA